MGSILSITKKIPKSSSTRLAINNNSKDLCLFCRYLNKTLLKFVCRGDDNQSCNFRNESSQNIFVSQEDDFFSKTILSLQTRAHCIELMPIYTRFSFPSYHQLNVDRLFPTIDHLIPLNKSWE